MVFFDVNRVWSQKILSKNIFLRIVSHLITSSIYWDLFHWPSALTPKHVLCLLKFSKSPLFASRQKSRKKIPTLEPVIRLYKNKIPHVGAGILYVLSLPSGKFSFSRTYSIPTCFFLFFLFFFMHTQHTHHMENGIVNNNTSRQFPGCV